MMELFGWLILHRLHSLILILQLNNLYNMLHLILLLSTYGNQTGVVKTPISRPYWIESDDQGRIVFNEQTANNISVMDPKSAISC